MDSHDTQEFFGSVEETSQALYDLFPSQTSTREVVLKYIAEFRKFLRTNLVLRITAQQISDWVILYRGITSKLAFSDIKTNC